MKLTPEIQQALQQSEWFTYDNKKRDQQRSQYIQS